MKPTRENYELFFIDYFDGNLSESQMAELMHFLLINPDLKKEFDSFENITLTHDQPITMPNKDGLKKTIYRDLTSVSNVSDSNSEKSDELVPDETLVALLEGDLTETESNKLRVKMESNPTLKNRYYQFTQTILQADVAIIFQAKTSLKRYSLFAKGLVLRRLAVAATIAGLLFTTYLLVPDSGKDQIAITNAEQLFETENFNSIVMPDTDYSVPQSVEPKPVVIPSNATQLPAAQPETEVKLEVKPEEKPRGIQSNKIAYIPSATSIELLASNNTPANISSRDDFYWVTFVGNTPVEEDDAPAEQNQNPNRTPVTSFANLAYDGIERSTGWDVREFQSQVKNGKYGIWDLAGQGLASIGQLTGRSLAVDRQQDEDGKITSLGIGERFKISRQKSN